MSLIEPRASGERSACSTIAPSGSRRSSLVRLHRDDEQAPVGEPARAPTARRRGLGDDRGRGAIEVRANTARPWMSLNHSAPSCHRGPSPKDEAARGSCAARASGRGDCPLHETRDVVERVVGCRMVRHHERPHVRHLGDEVQLDAYARGTERGCQRAMRRRRAPRARSRARGRVGGHSGLRTAVMPTGRADRDLAGRARPPRPQTRPRTADPSRRWWSTTPLTP